MKYNILGFLLAIILPFSLLFPVQSLAQSYRCTCPGNVSCGTYTTQSVCDNHAANDCGGSAGVCTVVGSSSSGSSGNVQPLQNPLGDREIPTIVGDAVRIALGVVGAIALALFVYGGFVWMSAGGNSARVGKGREILVWASIGLIVIFLSYAILQFIINTLIGAS